MNRIWAIAGFTIRDAIRRRVWYPFFGMMILAVLLMVMQFGFTASHQNPYADNIISSFFFFWAWGTLFTGMILGASALPVERRTPVLWTLPMQRWHLIVGKLIGAQILLSGLVLLGFGLSLVLAIRQHLPISSYAGLGLVTALSSVFICLCLSIPLGARLSGVGAGTVALFLPLLPSFTEVMEKGGFVDHSWLVAAIKHVLPFRVDTHPMNNAFWANVVQPGQYASLGWSILFSFALFVVLVTLINRSEVSLKS
jgi:ABC-type transport system involved in multi-copper enzyme maturation permease subunit